MNCLNLKISGLRDGAERLPMTEGKFVSTIKKYGKTQSSVFPKDMHKNLNLLTFGELK